MKPYFNKILLGAGGEHPRIDGFDPDSGCIQNIMNLPQMHSVYAIDTNVKNGNIAIGTKGGVIYVISQETIPINTESLQPTILLQGAPVVSVCWISESLLGASDISGRCLLWNIDMGTKPRVLKVLKGVDCNLLMLKDEILAGLSSSGKLIFCHPCEDKLVHVIDTPPIPIKTGLVKMVHWKGGDALAFPGKSGHLIIANLKDYRIRSLEAHEGSLYAISIWGDGLVTAGMDDSRLKIWLPDCKQATQNIKLSEGVIASATVYQFHQSKIILIDSKGRAATYIHDDNKFQFVKRVSGEDYRSIEAPDQKNLMASYNEQKEKKALDIVSDILEKNDRLSPDENVKNHYQLIELGYKHVSLAIQIENAVLKGDISEGIRLYAILLRIIPLDNPNSIPSMEKYASLLEKVWQMDAARGLYGNIISIDPDYTFSVRPDAIEQMAQIMRENKSIIQLDIPIDHVIKSATAIGKQFFGRFVIGNTKPKICNRMKLTSKMIVEKYAQIRMETEGKYLPDAVTEKLWWLRKDQADQVEVVVCDIGQTNENKRFQLVLQINTGEMDTFVIPVIIFNMDYVETEKPIEKINDNALEMLAKIRKAPFSNAYLAAIHWAMDQALRRLVTEHSPNRRI